MASSSVLFSASPAALASPTRILDDFSGLRRVSVKLQFAGRPCKLTIKAAEMSSIGARKPLMVSCKSTLDEVSDIIATQLSVDRSSVNPDTKFSELGADSLDTVEIVMTLEEKFGVSIGEQDAENVSTVQQVVDLIEKQTVSS